MRFLRHLLVLFWIAAVFTVLWGLIDGAGFSRRRAALAREMVTSRAAGLDPAPLRERDAELRDLRTTAWLTSLGGGVVAVLIPLGWGLYTWRRRRPAREGASG